jgi:hypothetical protein
MAAPVTSRDREGQDQCPEPGPGQPHETTTSEPLLGTEQFG